MTMKTDRPGRRHVTWTDDAAAHGEEAVMQVEERRNRAAGILPPEEPADPHAKTDTHR